jgi:putative phage-type endonuclease
MTCKLISIPQDTPEWHEFRSTRIGASDAPVIMGVSPWKTPYQLWEEKMGFSEPMRMNPAMAMGKKMEPKLLAHVSEMLNVPIVPQVLQHANFDWAIASMDGYNHDERIGVEIKLANLEDHREICDERVPKKYYPQLQHQMFVSGLPFMYYYSYHREGPMMIRVTRDDEYISQMVEKEMEFMNCLLAETPPKEVAMGNDEMDSLMNLSQELCDVWEKKKEIESREEALIEAIKAFQKPFAYKGVKIYEKTVRGRIQYDRIEALKDMDLEVYRGPTTTSWTVCRGK